MNLNMLFDKMTNFKIKFIENPSPVKISNKDLIFIIDETDEDGCSRSYDCDQYEFKNIKFNKNTDTVEITLG